MRCAISSAAGSSAGSRRWRALDAHLRTARDLPLREAADRGAIAHDDVLPAQRDPATILERTQQAGDHLPHAAELVGQLLVRDVDGPAARRRVHEQQRGQPLVELARSEERRVGKEWRCRWWPE